MAFSDLEVARNLWAEVVAGAVCVTDSRATLQAFMATADRPSQADMSWNLARAGVVDSFEP